MTSVVTPLQRALNFLTEKQIREFLGSLNCGWKVGVTPEGRQIATIETPDGQKFDGSHPVHRKPALVDALAKFLRHEQRDFHEVREP